MSAETDNPHQEATASSNNAASHAFPPTTTQALAGTASSISLPQKRAIDESHAPRPSVPSPLNPEVSRSTPKAPPTEEMPAKRTKKETLKKRESKGAFGPDSKSGTPDPKAKTDQQVQAPSADSPLRYKLPPAKSTDFDAPRGPLFTFHHKVPTLDGNASIEFCETSDHVYNKKSYRYSSCIADPAFPSSLFYRQSEPEPYGPHLEFEDSAMHMFFDKSGKHVTTDKGFRMTRANVAIREGRFYWEVKITRGILRSSTRTEGSPESHGHVRLGFARREAAVDAPVGFDCYSYGIRDKQGQKVYMSRPKEFFPENEDFCEGDVIGLEIKLPSESLQRKVLTGHFNPAVDLVDDDYTAGVRQNAKPEAPNIVRDRIPIRFKAHIYFEQIDYHTTKELEELMNIGLDKPASSMGTGSIGFGGGPADEVPHPNHPLHALRTLPGSYIKVYKNGQLMGTAFEDLLAFLPPASRPLALNGAREGLDDGMLGYYPAISVFRGGAAEANFGPDFWYPPPDYAGGDIETSAARNHTGNQSDTATAVPGSGSGSNEPPLRAVSERYTEQIVEDIVYDLVDEVDFWMQDGAQILDHSGRDDLKTGSTGLGVDAGEEIKEVVQDD